jgi:hypothetical protein
MVLQKRGRAEVLRVDPCSVAYQSYTIDAITLPGSLLAGFAALNQIVFVEVL